MNTRPADRQIIAVLLTALLPGGCVLPMSPLTNQAHVVTPATNQTDSVVFKEPQVWYDRSFAPTRGIRFPQGEYYFVAEDSEYRFFKAPSDLEYRILQGDHVTDDRFMPGGLCLSKGTFDLVPAGAYLFVDAHTNVLTWKLGRDFMDMEGGRWEKKIKTK